MIKKVIAPVRIDFAGGTTDIYPFTKKYGGAVLNAAINKYVTGELISTNKKVGLSYQGNIPTSSGLGTSGVMNLIWLALISKIKDKKQLAENVYNLEQSQGLVGGKQDQYAAAFGGINFLEFKDNKTKITRLNLNKKIIRQLENNLVLVYIGEHYSGFSNKVMINNLKKGKNTKNLIKIRDIAKEMKTALLKNNLDKFAELMNQETENRRKLHKSIIPSSTQKIINLGKKHGAISAKILGAGGGGSILFFGNKAKLKRKFGKKVIDFKFDFSGLRFF
tara:strand:+ start:668 stop:1498 length:831 start_codon:yes stop_codon:yes gene_type:complete